MARTRAANKRSASPAPQSTSSLATSTQATPPKKRRTRKGSSDTTSPAPFDTRTPKKKTTVDDVSSPPATLASSKSATATLAKKLKQLETYQQTPFPDWSPPSPQTCQNVCNALATVHKLPQRPAKIENLESVGAACGLVPSVLDALVRTILSQNTTNKNSTTARRGIEETFGKSGDGPNYEAVKLASQEELATAIQSGGLANVKSKVIKTILNEVFQKHGTLSLDHLHAVDDQTAMKELVSYHGVGPKTASCVLLFCLNRESFAVDTHVFRITKALGWTPPRADRESAFRHLDVRIPGHLKYPLHSMLVRHGRECKNCSASGSPTKEQRDQCPLRPHLSRKPTKDLEEDQPDGILDAEEIESPIKKARKPKKEEHAEGDMHGL